MPLRRCVKGQIGDQALAQLCATLMGAVRGLGRWVMGQQAQFRLQDTQLILQIMHQHGQHSRFMARRWLLSGVPVRSC